MKKSDVKKFIENVVIPNLVDELLSFDDCLEQRGKVSIDWYNYLSPVKTSFMAQITIPYIDKNKPNIINESTHLIICRNIYTNTYKAKLIECKYSSMIDAVIYEIKFDEEYYSNATMFF